MKDEANITLLYLRHEIAKLQLDIAISVTQRNEYEKKLVELRERLRIEEEKSR